MNLNMKTLQHLVLPELCIVIIDHVCQWPINMHTIQSTIANTMQSPICFLLCISLYSLYLLGMNYFKVA